MTRPSHTNHDLGKWQRGWGAKGRRRAALRGSGGVGGKVVEEGAVHVGDDQSKAHVCLIVQDENTFPRIGGGRNPCKAPSDVRHYGA